MGHGRREDFGLPTCASCGGLGRRRVERKDDAAFILPGKRFYSADPCGSCAGSGIGMAKPSNDVAAKSCHEKRGSE